MFRQIDTTLILVGARKVAHKWQLCLYPRYSYNHNYKRMKTSQLSEEAILRWQHCILKHMSAIEGALIMILRSIFTILNLGRMNMTAESDLFHGKLPEG